MTPATDDGGSAAVANAVRFAADAIFTTDARGDIASWNPGAEQLYGYPADAVVGLRAAMLLATSGDGQQASPGSDLERLRLIAPDGADPPSMSGDPFDTCIRTGKTLDRHLVLHRRADGTEVWTSLSLAPLPGGAGVVVVAHDASPEVSTQRSLAASEATFRMVAEHATDVISLFRMSAGRPQFLYISPSSTEVLGRTPEEYYTDPEGAMSAVHPDDADQVEEDVIAGRGNLTRISRPDGSMLWADIRTRVFPGSDGKPEMALSVTRDVTDRVEAERAMRASEERYRTIVETMQEGILVTDPTGAIAFANARMGEILQCETADMLGRSPFDFVAPEQVEQARAQEKRYHEGKTESSEFAMVRPDGSRRWIRATASPLRSDDGRAGGLLATVTDITDRRTATEQLAHMAMHDSLTGLPNRALFRDRLQQANANATRDGSGMAVLFLDVDHFKLVNDSLGHRAGDELLQDVARRLSTAVRPGDTVARLGGDEFAVLCAGVDGAAALVVAERLLQAFDEPVVCGPGRQFVTASIGIAIGPSPQADDLIGDADTAMYRAKDEGRSRIALYDAGLRLAMTQRLEITNDLRDAIDDNELVVYYQPIIELASGNVVAAEALLRWNHPERGLLGAADFINVAEASGLIVPIGRWVLRQACLQAAAWRRGGLNLGVSVNFSARQLADESVVEFIAAVLRECGLEPEQLMLEVTESAVLGDTARAERILKALKSTGLRLAIDDFGTGYSSLSYLRRFPVDTIKLDRSFVLGMLSERDDETIVAAVLGLADHLGLVAVAEGVESREQLERLRVLGCAYGQGFLWSPAVPAAQFVAEVRSARAAPWVPRVVAAS